MSWNEGKIVHLLKRAAFSAAPDEVEACLSLGQDETVRRLVNGESLTGTGEYIKEEALYFADAEFKNDREKMTGEQLYWLYRMVYTTRPLVEKMTLFWHNHFATSFRKVRNADYMIKQNQLLREHALGSFRELLRKIGRDPAMMVWLDSNQNRKGHPNENYAREVMELFTLGIGNYTEDDIKEAARAFTGWQIKKESGEAVFLPKRHDGGVKTLLGYSGSFNSDDVVDILFKQKALPRFMARKLLTFFASPNPPDDWVEQVAFDFATKPTAGEVLENLFLSERFYAPENRQTLVKTPAEFVAGTLRTLNMPPVKAHTGMMRKMGQELYVPPNVAGWPGGENWLNSSLLLTRCQFAEKAAKSQRPDLFNSDAYASASSDAKELVQKWGWNLGVAPLSPTTVSALAHYADDAALSKGKNRLPGLRGLMQLLLISPEAQMK